MKTLFLSKTAWLAVLFCVLALSGLSAQSSRSVIREVRGTVEIKRPGSSAWAPAAPGQELTGDTQISTGFKSSALISLGNSTLTVQPLTRLSLEEIRAAAEAEQVNVRLQAGRIRVNVKPPAEGTVNFTVRSPTATASVRGTAFEFDTVNLRVDEGTVRFSGGGAVTVYVRAGETGAPDPVTGKTAAPVETAAALAPPPPAGVEDIGVSAAAAVPSAADLDIGITWE
ncbi:MAG: FecR family protein [Treponema sp.]|jgi:hypothetical protein|nr:FecR family protein [Treponema sp.]